MDVIRTIRPGKPGSARFLQHWGDRLVAVRYRKDAATHKLYTTIEIIVDEREQAPEGVSLTHQHAARRNEIVAVPIGYDELELRSQVKQQGARWSREKRVWLMRYDVAVVLGVQNRVIEGLAEQCTDVDISFEVG